MNIIENDPKANLEMIKQKFDLKNKALYYEEEDVVEISPESLNEIML